MASVLITFEVRVADRDGTIRAHEFVDQGSAIRFAEFQEKAGYEIINVNIVTRNMINDWRRREE